MGIIVMHKMCIVTYIYQCDSKLLAVNNNVTMFVQCTSKHKTYND